MNLRELGKFFWGDEEKSEFAITHEESMSCLNLAQAVAREGCTVFLT
tara:strand:+ start:372 stop:512 length:141 start_codon:yes stop_codon:yes gene_type:complete